MDIDFEEEERKKRERIGNRRRNSVSSETVRHSEIQKEFPVHPKTPEQEMSIFNILSSSILLKHLEAGPSQIITKAMFKKDLKAGDVVMKQNEDGDNFYIIDEGARTRVAVLWVCLSVWRWTERGAGHGQGTAATSDH
jgi:cAMP-dependent protein kinase regulator